MKPVVQLERTGCGIASVAALACASYAQAKRVANRLGIFANDPKLWSETGHVRRFLKEYGIRSARIEVPFISWEACRILRCLPSGGTKSGIVLSGIGWCSGAGLWDLSCSIRSAPFVTTCALTSVV